MARRDPQFNVRIPAELKQAIEDAAKENNRSINSEIVYRLQQSFENEDEHVPGFKQVEFKMVDNYRLGAGFALAKALDEAIKALEDVSKSLVEISEEDEACERRVEPKPKESESKRKMDELKKSF